MKMTALSHQGLVRLNNEDSVLVDMQQGFAILADGMGGLLAGEEASEKAVQTARENLRLTPVCDPALVVQQAHEGVRAHAEQKKYLGKMGTTLVLWAWRDGAAQFGHVGDSRLYSFADGELRQLTHDHTVAQRMVDEGVISQDEIHNAPNQHVLTQAIGMPGSVSPDVGPTPTRGRLLLCSDGLSDLVSADVIAQLMAEEDIAKCAKQLIKAALDKGGRDNVSVIVIDLDH